MEIRMVRGNETVQIVNRSTDSRHGEWVVLDAHGLIEVYPGGSYTNDFDEVVAIEHFDTREEAVEAAREEGWVA